MSVLSQYKKLITDFIQEDLISVDDVVDDSAPKTPLPKLDDELSQNLEIDIFRPSPPKVAKEKEGYKPPQVNVSVGGSPGLDVGEPEPEDVSPEVSVVEPEQSEQEPQEEPSPEVSVEPGEEEPEEDEGEI